MNNANGRLRSITGQNELENEANIEMENGNYIRAKQHMDRLVQLREHYLTNPPYATRMDVANAHQNADNLLNVIMRKLNDADGALTTKYKIESENHMIRATELS